MTNLIVDASVAVKWFADEITSDKARALGDGKTQLFAPELVIAEVGNALWKKCAKGLLSITQVIAGMHTIPTLFDGLYPIANLAPRAVEIAHTLRHPIYDCFYLALAEREGMPVISADDKLMAAAKRLGTAKVLTL